MIWLNVKRSLAWEAWPPVVGTSFRQSKMRWRKWPMILNSITGKRDTGFSGEHEKHPTSNIQHPENIQDPKSNINGCLGLGAWRLDLLWMLDVGCWMFCPGMLPCYRNIHRFALSRPRPNQPHFARQPLPVHR